MGNGLLPAPALIRTLFTLLLVLSEVVERTHAFYEKGSDVVPLTKSNWKEVKKSEFLWMVEFYREGCGYCQLLTPEYEKVATNLKHLVRVGAVNTEAAGGRELAGDHGDPDNPISGVPTIKFFVPQPGKKAKRIVVYNGERKAKAMINYATELMPSNVTRGLNSKTFPEFESRDMPRAVLFTDKTSTPTLFKALSVEFKGKIALGEVSSSNTKLTKRYNVTSFPTLVSLEGGAGSGSWEQPLPADFVQAFEGKSSFNSINMFLSKYLRRYAKAAKDRTSKGAGEL